MYAGQDPNPVNPSPSSKTRPAFIRTGTMHYAMVPQRWDSCVVSTRTLKSLPRRFYDGSLSNCAHLRQKFSEMWGPIVPLHGSAIKTEAIISWRSAYQGLPHQHLNEKRVQQLRSPRGFEGLLHAPTGTTDWDSMEDLGNAQDIPGYVRFFLKWHNLGILLANCALAKNPISRSPMATEGGRVDRGIKNLTTSATSKPGISPQGLATATVKACLLLKSRGLAWDMIGHLCRLAVVK